MKLSIYNQIIFILFILLLTIDIKCFSTEFENRIQTNMNISGRFFKSKNVKSGNQDKIDKKYKESLTEKSNNKNHEKFDSLNGVRKNPNNINNIEIRNPINDIRLNELKDSFHIDSNIGVGPKYASGWIKFFKYLTTNESKNFSNQKNPKTFIVNGQFKEQAKYFPNADLDEKSSERIDKLNLYIRNKFSFYAVLFKNNLNILSSRQTRIQKTYDNINLAHLANVIESNGFQKGEGIEEFGNFSEGYCFKLNLILQPAETYVICCEEKKTKSDFMNFMKKMKIQLQRNEGKVITPLKKENKEDSTLSGMLNLNTAVSCYSNNKVENLDKNNKKPSDGYWIVLQNWSQCTLKCGGGKSYLQRVCVPPKNGGKLCQGDPIISKDCNTNPCPKIEKKFQILNSNNSTILKPLIKIMPFSSRPQRYSKCVIKEGDILYTKNYNGKNNEYTTDSGGENPDCIEGEKIPIRVVMNNRTISLFAGQDYDTHIETFVLKKSRFNRDLKSEECFIISEEKGNKQAQLCGFSEGKKLVEEWDYDFHLFKYQCNEKKEEHKVDEFQKKVEDKIKDIKKNLLAEAENEMKHKAQKNEEMKLELKVKNTNNVAFRALQKELNLEELVKQEEIEREKKEVQTMLKNIEEEKKKKECLLRAIKEKELENQYNLREKETSEAIKSIKKAALHEVQVRRLNLRKMIEEMRIKQKHKTSNLSQKLQEVKYEMAKQMGKAYKKGDRRHCNKMGNGNESKEKKEMRKNYCAANYSDDFVNFQACNNGEDFCHMCCDTEFGEFYVEEREKCYSLACLVKDIDSSKKIEDNN